MIAPVADEWLLLIAMTGLYALDAGMLLYGNEWFLLRSGGRWHARFPGNHWQWMGRKLYLPHLLRPDQPMIRVAWQETAGTPATGQQLAALLEQLAALRPLKTLQYILALSLLALPLLLRFAPSRTLLLCASLAGIYATLAGMLAWIWRQRMRWPLVHSRRQYARLAFEWLICPPFGINATRKLALSLQWPGDAPAFAANSIPAHEWAGVRKGILQQIEDELMVAGHDTPRALALESWKHQVQTRYPLPPDPQHS